MNSIEVLICPANDGVYVPTKVWESPRPDNVAVRYGQFPRHSHDGHECEWSLLVRKLEEYGDEYAIWQYGVY